MSALKLSSEDSTAKEAYTTEEIGRTFLDKLSDVTEEERNRILSFILYYLPIALEDGYWGSNATQEARQAHARGIYAKWLEANNGVIPDWRDTWNYERVYSND